MIFDQVSTQQYYENFQLDVPYGLMYLMMGGCIYTVFSVYLTLYNHPIRFKRIYIRITLYIILRHLTDKKKF